MLKWECSDLNVLNLREDPHKIDPTTTQINTVKESWFQHIGETEVSVEFRLDEKYEFVGQVRYTLNSTILIETKFLMNIDNN